jgi:hypothetical protein
LRSERRSAAPKFGLRSGSRTPDALASAAKLIDRGIVDASGLRNFALDRRRAVIRARNALTGERVSTVEHFAQLRHLRLGVFP